MTKPQISSVGNRTVTVEHARHLISVYDKVPAKDRPWYYEWAKTIDRLASALQDTGVPEHFVSVIASGQVEHG